MRTHLIIVGLILGPIACADRTTPTSASLATRSVAGPSSEQPESEAERPFRELARVAPSHGGLYFDTLTGDLTVYLKDLREGPAAKRALPSLLGQPLTRARVSHPHAGIVFKQGAYTFTELALWRDALDDVLGPPSVQWFGIDHARNRIVIGVVANADRQAITSMAVDLAIPAGALRFETTTPVHSEQTLQDSIRPVKGGIRLERVVEPPDIVDRCTLGFLALWGGEHAFVTNSHCSSQRFAPDGTKLYQNRAPLTPPESLSITSVGYEVTDTYYEGHFGGRISRADAAVYLATLGPGDWYFQRIARPVSGCSPSCTPPVLTIDPDPSRIWSIVRTEPNIIVGQLVSKIGQKTGWTQSFVLMIDQKVFVAEGTYTGQVFSDYGSDRGDSGAPVLLDILGGADTTVTLGGLHWGRTDDLVYAIFSPWSGILQMYPGLRVN